MAAIKDKLVELVAINMAKERYGDASRKDQCYIEAEELLKTLLLQVLVEKANGGDPLQYVECLENFAEICGWDCYDVYFIESLIFSN